MHYPIKWIGWAAVIVVPASITLRAVRRSLNNGKFAGPADSAGDQIVDETFDCSADSGLPPNVIDPMSLL